MSDNRTHAFSENMKCAGIGCKERESCERFTMPEVKNQVWGSFYALGAAAMQLPCENIISNKIKTEAA